LSGIIYIQDN